MILIINKKTLELFSDPWESSTKCSKLSINLLSKEKKPARYQQGTLQLKTLEALRSSVSAFKKGQVKAGLLPPAVG